MEKENIGNRYQKNLDDRMAKAIILMQNHKENLGTGFDSLNYSQSMVTFQD